MRFHCNKTSDHTIKVRVNDNKTLQCQIYAPTVKDVANNRCLDKRWYDAQQLRSLQDNNIHQACNRKPGNLSTITPEDQGKYTCYSKCKTSHIKQTHYFWTANFRMYFKKGTHFTNIIAPLSSICRKQVSNSICLIRNNSSVINVVGAGMCAI